VIDVDFFLICCAPAVLVVAVLLVWHRASFWRTIEALTLSSYIMLLMALTLFPLPIDSRYIHDARGYRAFDYNVVPLETIRNAFGPGAPSGAGAQVIGNLLILAPFAFLLPMLWPRLGKWRLIVLAGFGASCTIEAVQLAVSGILGFSYKSFDVDDIILNTVGIAGAYVLFLLARRVARVVRRNKLDTSSEESHFVSSQASRNEAAR
jgi:glycopeptide antibiotics resistance protein